ncbi:MAG: hypothetical protein V3S18_03825 [Dehalococcoidia bacterium]
MVTAAQNASLPLAPDFRLGRPEAVAVRRRSVSTYVAVAAAGAAVALSILQLAITSGSGADFTARDPGVTSVYATFQTR